MASPQNLRVPKIIDVDRVTTKELIVPVSTDLLEAYGYYGYEYEYGDGQYPKTTIDSNGIYTDLPMHMHNHFRAMEFVNEDGDNFHVFVDNSDNFRFVKDA